MATARKDCLFESDGGNEMNYQCQACDIWYRHLVNIITYVLFIEHIFSRLQTWRLCETLKLYRASWTENVLICT